MAERKVGRVAFWRNLSPNLAVFRVIPENGAGFPDYHAGQYISLGRDDCGLTRKALVDGKTVTVPDLDDSGRQKLGPVTHFYSIASAPFETKRDRYLEFYVVLQRDGEGHPGRLTRVLFGIDLDDDNRIHYFDHADGNFTLEHRIRDSRNVLFVGTGTGMAPFVSMIKQLHHEAEQGAGSQSRYTLIQVSRTREELGYYDEFCEMEKSGRLDFLYVPALSRPSARDRENPTLGAGRANNILRRIFDMPVKEAEDLRKAEVESTGIDEARSALQRATVPELPRRLRMEDVRSRLNPEGLVLLSCGNPQSLADIRHIANVNQIRFEREDW